MALRHHGEKADDLLESGNAKAPATPWRSSGIVPREDWWKRALSLPGARVGSVPADFGLQLTRPEQAPPAGDAWLHESKWDGYRMSAAVDSKRVQLRSRKGLDWSERFPEISVALSALPAKNARFDGELVALDTDGNSDFSELQRALKAEQTKALRYALFDLLGLDGVDLRGAELLARKTLLEEVLASTPSSVLVYSPHVVGNGSDAFVASRAAGLEGIVSKRIDSRYEAGRSSNWVKSKHHATDDFVVVGYTTGKGSRADLGALLLARRDGGLTYVGKVGTGFHDKLIGTLLERLQPLERATPTVELPAHARIARKQIHWVTPTLTVEVASRGWGKEGLLRQASFERIRDDKEPIEAATKRVPRVVSFDDEPPSPEVGTRTSSRVESSSVPAVTHPEKVLFPDDGITKGQVFEYYRAVSRWMLPELQGRPLSLLRSPSGIDTKGFFQKHHSDALGAHVGAVEVLQKSGIEDYIYVDSATGLLELVQMNTLELHPWGCRVDDVEHPDRFVLDLDPAEDVEFQAVRAAAREIRAQLELVHLQSFVRTSGGKGLHLVVPFSRGPSWEHVKQLCEAFAQLLATREPSRYVATMNKARRKGRIFIDWMRNSRGATSVASWSVRARPGAPVAVPLTWTELDSVLSPQQFTLESAQERAVKLAGDPWAELADVEQALPDFPAWVATDRHPKSQSTDGGRKGMTRASR